MNKATKIILLILAIFVPLTAVGVTLLVVNLSGFRTKPGKEPGYSSIPQAQCESDAAQLYIGHYYAAYPRGGEVERTDSYTEDGYPVYVASWYYPGSLDEGEKAHFECRIGTSKDSIYPIDLRQDGKTLKVYEDATIVDKNGNEL